MQTTIRALFLISIFPLCLLYFLFSDWEQDCGNRVLAHHSGEQELYVFQRACGVGSGFSVNVSTFRRGDSLSNEDGNYFVAVVTSEELSSDDVKLSVDRAGVWKVTLPRDRVTHGKFVNKSHSEKILIEYY
ncbi:hypothetical protein [Thalassotalea fusca]